MIPVINLPRPFILPIKVSSPSNSWVIPSIRLSFIINFAKPYNFLKTKSVFSRKTCNFSIFWGSEVHSKKFLIPASASILVAMDTKGAIRGPIHPNIFSNTFSSALFGLNFLASLFFLLKYFDSPFSFIGLSCNSSASRSLLLCSCFLSSFNVFCLSIDCSKSSLNFCWAFFFTYFFE